MADATRGERGECVIREARRYRAAVRRLEALGREEQQPAHPRLWREVQEAERSLFDTLDALDEAGRDRAGRDSGMPVRE